MLTPWLPVICVLSEFVGFAICTQHRPSSEDDPGPTVPLTTGIVRGFRYILPHLSSLKGVAFLGIPFAKPPVGELRFLYPKPVDSWSGIRNATTLPNSCYQAPDLFFGPDFYGSSMWNPNTPVSEDCLYVNVWIPVAKASGKWKPDIERLPVMVWIYGGGFYSGTSTLDVYDGQMLASVNKVIVVSVAYRVGALGFLCLDDPSAPCNVGMFDQLLALDWVQQNIRRFGGDPDNVTLFGESAGAASVSLHLLSRLSRDKFRRCILQSGTANMPWATTSLAEGKRRSIELAESYLDCKNAGDDMQNLSNCLRSVEAPFLVDQQWVSRGILQFPFLPVVDGFFLTEEPSVSLRHRRFKKCPILLGSNRNEGSWFIVYELSDHLSRDRKSMPRKEFLSALRQLFFYYPQYRSQKNSSAVLDAAIAFRYTDWTDQNSTDSNVAALDSAIGDYFFFCPLNDFAQSYASAGLRVYSYYFVHRYASNPWPEWMGVLHGDDVLFVFGHVLKQGLDYTESDRGLSRLVMRYWTNFARTG